MWFFPTVRWSGDWCSPVGKLHYLQGFIFLPPLWFLVKLLSWSKFFICSPFYKSLYISVGLIFWCCWPMNEKESSCGVGVMFYLLAQPIKYFDPQQQKGFCVLCSHLGPISNTHFCDFFTKRSVWWPLYACLLQSARISVWWCNLLCGHFPLFSQLKESSICYFQCT